MSTRWARVLASLLIIFASACSIAKGASLSELLENYQRFEIATGELYCTGAGVAAEEAWARRFLPEALARCEDKLGRTRERAFRSVIVGSFEELARIVEGRTGRRPKASVVGVAIPRDDLLIVRSDIVSPKLNDGTHVTLVHEVAHLVIHRDASAMPRWRDEGLAQWVSESRLDARTEAELGRLARVGGLYSLAELERAFPKEHASTTVAYQQSLHLASFIDEEYGPEAIVRLLDAVEGGAGAAAAIHEVFGLELAEFEEQFIAWAVRRVSWWTIALSYVNVWTLAGPLALIAVLRGWRKRRRQMRRLAAEEPSDPDLGSEKLP